MSSSRLVLGTADLADDSLTLRLLDQFHAGGGRALDLANVYGDGDAERGVGRWLRTRRREGVVLYAKGCHPPRCSPDAVPAEVDKALTLLGIEQVDVFSLHRDDQAVPVESWGEALVDQVARGTLRNFGVSNWSLERVRALTRYLTEIDRNHLVAFSNHFSLAMMEDAPWPGCLAVDEETLHDLWGSGLLILAWASLAGGYFAGRERSDPVVERGWDSEANRARRRRATELADRIGTSASVIALSYVLHQPANVLPVFGTRSESHLAEAQAAEAVRLTPEQLAWLETGAAHQAA